MISRFQRLSLYASLSVLTLTGVAFAIMKYGMKTDDPFAVANHPLQPWMLAAHVVFAPAGVFAFGWIFSGHVAPGFANRGSRKRRSGLWSAWILVPMVMTGYLLQVSSGDAVREGMAAAHWITSGVFVVGFAVHTVADLVRGRASQPPG